MTGVPKFRREGPPIRRDRDVKKFVGPAAVRDREAANKETDEKKRKLIEQMKRNKT